MAECREDREWLVEYLQVVWSDIHFAREQDWRILLGPFISVLAMLATASFDISRANDGQVSIVTIIASIIAVAFSTSGFMITLRHRKLFMVKKKAVDCIERWLGLNCLINIYKKMDTKLRAGYVILSIYSVLIASSLGVLVYALTAARFTSVFTALSIYTILIIIAFSILSRWESQVRKIKCPPSIDSCAKVEVE